MELVIQLFPGVVVVAILIGLGLAANLKKKISGGATHAGPMNRVEPTVPGLTSSAWDAQTIETALSNQPDTVVALLDSMATSLPGTQGFVRAQGLGVGGIPAVNHLVEQLETHLELPGLLPPRSSSPAGPGEAPGATPLPPGPVQRPSNPTEGTL